MLSHLTIKMASQRLYTCSQDASGTVVCKKRTEKESNSPRLIITAAQVVKHKETIYPSGWARYDLGLDRLGGLEKETK